MSATVTVVDHPLVQEALARLRDATTPMAGFRRELKRVGFFLGYEALRDAGVIDGEVKTPVGTAQATRLAAPLPAFVTIMRAGNGLLDGLMDLLPEAPVGHLGLYRDEKTLKPVGYYEHLPPRPAERLVLVCDPMLATGHTAAHALTRLKQAGIKRLHYICLLAAPEGLKCLQEAHPDVPVWTCSIDSHLNEHGYIIPGLGDAGDRLYGTT